MTTAQVAETPVTVNNNSPIQDYVNADDQTQPTFEMTPGFKPFTKSKIVVHFIYPFIGCVHAPLLNKIRERISKSVQLFLWGGGSCTRATLLMCPFKEAVNGWEIKKLQ